MTPYPYITRRARGLAPLNRRARGCGLTIARFTAWLFIPAAMLAALAWLVIR
jgi:hypothetical protein